VTGRQCLNALKGRAARTERKECKEVIESPWIGLWPDGAGVDEGLNLRSEEDEVALARPKQGADANAIPREDDFATREVNQRKGKLTFEIGKQVLTVLLIEMDNDFAVTMRAKHMPLGLEVRPALGKVEQLSVADNRDTAIFVQDRLLTVLKAHDAQSAMRKTDPWCKQET
jgi:hypothetical protein